MTGIVLGILVGWLAPAAGIAMEPIGTTFVNAMRMLIGPIVFLTIVGGIASVADLKKVGMTGLKALTYFQIGTIFALLFGLVAINIFRLGDGVNADASTIKTTDSAAKLIDAGAHQEWWQFLTHIIPTSVVGPFVEGDILQIIFIAVIFGIALNAMGKVGAPVLDGVQRLTGVMFKILGFIMKAAPAGRVRRDGLRRRQVRRLLPLQHGRADRPLLRHLDPLRRRGPRLRHGLPEAEHLQDDPPPQRGVPAHPGHLHRRTGPARA